MTAPAHRRHDISDKIWEKLAPHLPGREGSWGGIAYDNRTFAINRPLDWCRLLRGGDKYIELICNGIIKKEDILLEDMA